MNEHTTSRAIETYKYSFVSQYNGNFYWLKNGKYRDAAISQIKLFVERYKYYNSTRFNAHLIRFTSIVSGIDSRVFALVIKMNN